MSVEGGAFRCFIHTDKDGNPFETTDIEDWNAHCTTAIEPPHEEEADYTCEIVAIPIMQNYPFTSSGPDG